MELHPEDFRFLQTLLKREGGMVVETGREYLCTARLAPVATRNDLASLAALVAELRKDDRRLVADVVDAMTVNETSWFRDTRVWTELANHLLPEVLERQRKLRRLDVWFAASSSGQEVYSFAMVLSEILGAEAKNWRINLVASDLSVEMVKRTETGIYSNHETGRGLSDQRRKRFMSQHGVAWQMNEDLRSWVIPRRINLTSGDLRLSGSFDLIMLRNVLIYFDPPTRNDVLIQASQRLAPDGRLVLGATEGALGVPPELTAVQCGSLVAYGLAGRSTTASEPLLSPPRRPRLASATAKDTPTKSTAASAPDDDGLTAVERLRALRAEYHASAR